MRLLLSALVAGSLLVAGCVHRPYYRDLVGTASAEKEIRVRITDAASGRPLGNILVNVGAGTQKVSAMSDVDGIVVLPVKKSLLDPYTVVDVVRPAGVGRYDLERLPSGQPTVAPMTTATPVTDTSADAGT